LKSTIFPIQAFTDNYIWCVHNPQQALCVDPGDASKVIEYLKQNNLTLKTILITHHHYDHIDGVQELSERYNCKVFKPNDSRIPDYNNSLNIDETSVINIDYLDLQLKVLTVPGHTLSHVAYYNDKILFCGDTLFSLGCGRLFEGTPAQMLNSLNKFKLLADDTAVYCTHEYTLSNLNFSLSITPNDKPLQSAKSIIEKKLIKKQTTLPSSIGFEKQSNLFLRTNNNDLINRLKAKGFKNLDTQVSVFTALRQLKDEF
jgi:hydroxyacylglutathione hydrolase